MNKCPITYEPCGEASYSTKGVRLLSPQLRGLKVLRFTALELRQQAAARAGKMSIQGVQPKLSARLKIKNKQFEIVDLRGNYILKPPSDSYPQVPENEDLSMKLAHIVGIEVPIHGLVYAKDGSFTYFIKRFDRYGRNKKYALEDFAQLTGSHRDTKYKWSMEKLLPVIEQHCSFPALEKLKLFRRVIFCFLTGNEDMHLKNFSLITRENITTLSPAYDLLNSTLLTSTQEELALPLHGKKSKLKAEDFIDYYAKSRMGLNKGSIQKVLNVFIRQETSIKQLIHRSFLSTDLQERYLSIFTERMKRLSLKKI